MMFELKLIVPWQGPLNVKYRDAGEYRLPQLTISSKDKGKDKEQMWNAEMHFYAIKAVQAVAQCLSYR